MTVFSTRALLGKSPEYLQQKAIVPLRVQRKKAVRILDQRYRCICAVASQPHMYRAAYDPLRLTGRNQCMSFLLFVQAKRPLSIPESE